MWRVQREQTIEVTFIGDKRGAGLSVAGVHDWQGIKRYRFNASDSKDVQARDQKFIRLIISTPSI